MKNKDLKMLEEAYLNMYNKESKPHLNDLGQIISSDNNFYHGANSIPAKKLLMKLYGDTPKGGVEHFEFSREGLKQYGLEDGMIDSMANIGWTKDNSMRIPQQIQLNDEQKINFHCEITDVDHFTFFVKRI